MFHFDITSASANIQDLTEKVRGGFGNADLALGQENGFPFKDSEITRGISITYEVYSYCWFNTLIQTNSTTCFCKVSKACVWQLCWFLSSKR